MNQNITYAQLLNLSMEEFANRKDKSLQELLLYIYHCQQERVACEYEISLKEIYKACIDIDEIVFSITYAFQELIYNADCDECLKYLTDYQKTFLHECASVDNPIQYWGDVGATTKAYYDLIAFFTHVFEELETWGYDLSELLTPCNE